MKGWWCELIDKKDVDGDNEEKSDSEVVPSMLVANPRSGGEGRDDFEEKGYEAFHGILGSGIDAYLE